MLISQLGKLRSKKGWPPSQGHAERGTKQIERHGWRALVKPQLTSGSHLINQLEEHRALEDGKECFLSPTLSRINWAYGLAPELFQLDFLASIAENRQANSLHVWDKSAAFRQFKCFPTSQWKVRPCEASAWPLTLALELNSNSTRDSEV